MISIKRLKSRVSSRAFRCRLHSNCNTPWQKLAWNVKDRVNNKHAPRVDGIMSLADLKSRRTIANNAKTNDPQKTQMTEEVKNSQVCDKEKHGQEHGQEHNHQHSHQNNEGYGSLFGHTHSHSHTHSHGEANELLSTNRETILSNPAVKITWIGTLVNIALALSKGVGGVYYHSQSLIADAIHSVSDMFADFMTLATVNFVEKPKNATKFPLGYGKIETVGAVFVSGILLLAGISIGWSSLLQVFEHILPSSIYEYASTIHIGHSHTPLEGLSTIQGGEHSPGSEAGTSGRPIPSMSAAWLAGGSIIVKELLFRKTMSVSKEMNSKVLVANAWHHRIDSMTAFVALLTVTGGNWLDIAWLDSVGGLGVSLFIIKAGWSPLKDSILELVDRGISKNDQLYVGIKNVISNELKQGDLGGLEMSELSLLTSGAITSAYVTISTSENYSLDTLKSIETRVEESIKREDKFVRNIFIFFKKTPRSTN